MSWAFKGDRVGDTSLRVGKYPERVDRVEQSPFNTPPQENEGSVIMDSSQVVLAK